MGETRRKLTAVEKLIGANLRNSMNSFGQAMSSVEVNMDKLVEFKNSYKKRGIRMSYTSLFVKAVAYALKENPSINSRLEGENLDELVTYDSINVGIGIDTPKGLIVAVVKDTQDKTLDQISEEVNDLVDRARVNKLKLEDIQGSTVTISNMTSTEDVLFTSIVSNNESIIYGFGKIKKEVIVDENDQIKIAHIGRVMQNINHTATTGMPALKSTTAIKTALEDPEKYLLP